MEEIWREILGFDGKYLISNLGNAASQIDKKFRLLKLYEQKGKGHGYIAFRTSFNGKCAHTSVSRSVAKSFPEICGEWFDGCEVDHINTIKSDNRAENLRVVTHRENLLNPITVSQRRKWMTDEEWNKYQKERDKYFKKKDRENNKEYYSNYMREYQKTEKFKEYRKAYYQKNREEILAKQKDRYRKKKSA